MLSSVLPLLAHLVTPALVVAWSPVKVIPALALAFNAPKPKAAGLGLLVGSLVGQAAVTAVFVQTPRLLDRFGIGLSTPPPGKAQVVVGLILIGLSAVGWATRRRVAFRAPAWLVRVTRVTPAAAAVLGTVLVVSNLKVLLANAAAGLVIGSTTTDSVQIGAALLWYTVIASSTLIVPIVGYLAAPDVAHRWIIGAKSRLVRHQVVATTILLALVGIALVSNGFRSA